MKSYLFLFFFFFYSTLWGQWQWSNPQPSGYINTSVVFTDSLTGFIVNNNGDILRTTDQGNSWHIQQNIPSAYTINYKDSTLIIGAFSCVYISTDMGQTWIQRPINQLEVVNNIQLISRDTIFIVSFNQSISTTHFFMSIDRGSNWQQINTSLTLKSFWMLNSHEGFAASYNGIYQTLDGGRNWQKPDTTVFALCSYIKFRDKNFGLAFAQTGAGQILRTTDGGLHWTASASSVGNLNSLAFVNQNSAVAVSDDGIIFHSADSCISWQAVFSNQHYLPCYSVYFINQRIGFVTAHSGGILKTTDGGINWTLYSPTYIDISAFQFITDSIGFAATWNNLYKTTNAGYSWSQLGITTPQNSDRWQYIHFFSKDTGIAISEASNKIYKTYNGGSNWKQINLNILYADNFLAAFCIDQTIFLSTDGAYGKLLIRSSDAGETWKTQYTASSYNDPYFRSLFFTDNKTGYGTYGYYVFKTVDSGRSWNQLNMMPVELLRHLWFNNTTTGYAIGDQSYITKTSDSGHTWNQLLIDSTNRNVPGDLSSVRFFNEKIGFVSSGRNIYRTTTNGYKWRLYGTLAWNINGIEIAKDTNLYVYGVNGSILKRNIREYEIDSLKADSISACKSNVSAIITTVLSSVDSVWVQYGISGYDSSIAATPLVINDTSLKVNATILNLLQNKNYKARLKLYYRGKYLYSDSITFTTSSQAIPVITLNNGVLYSSLQQGNQWYFNGAIIPSATQSSYTPTQAGSYTVNTTIGGCVSEMSSPISYVVTAVNDPLQEGSINIFPNPVQGTLYIQNNKLKKLEIEIYNSVGIEVITRLISKKVNLLDMQFFPSGIYLINITEVKTHKSLQQLIIKL